MVKLLLNCCLFISDSMIINGRFAGLLSQLIHKLLFLNLFLILIVLFFRSLLQPTQAWANLIQHDFQTYNQTYNQAIYYMQFQSAIIKIVHMNKIVLVQDQTDKISQIIKPKNNRGGLYLGNQIAATNLDILKSYNITAIITIAAELPNKYPSQISHLRISIDDQPLANIYDYLEESYNFIKKQLMKGNVFVHCRMGVSRSASIIIAYLMRKYRCSYNKAYTSVKAKRPKINPNEGFVMQLKKYGEKVQQLKKKSNSN